MERRISTEPGLSTAPASETSVKNSGWVKLTQDFLISIIFLFIFADKSIKSLLSAISGNDALYNLTSVGPMSLRVDMRYGNETVYAHYANFSIDSKERHYTLTVSGYTGSAGEYFSEEDTQW